MELGEDGGGGDSGVSGESGGAAGGLESDPESDGGRCESGGLSSSSEAVSSSSSVGFCGWPFFGLTQRGEYGDLGERVNAEGTEDENVRGFATSSPETKLNIERLQF